MKYLKQIDGLRALAVIAVIVHHWTTSSFEYSNILHYGSYGVDLFFVISGFLITSILLKQKENERPILENIKIFYIRRALRIFPIYYIFLNFLFIYNWAGLENYAISLLSYFFNLDMYINGWSKVMYIQHLWSLSVEEQFYLVWPIIVFLFINKKNAFVIISFLLAISFILCICFFLWTPYKELKLFTPYSFISLLLGALLSFIKEKNIKIKYPSLFAFLFLFLFVLFKSDIISHFPGKNLIGYLIPFPSLIFFFLIYKAAEGYKGIGKLILENNFLSSLGKISYGLYLYHMIIPFVFFSNDSITNVLINSIILLILSLCSWYLIETPFNNLKKRFSYKEQHEALNKNLVIEQDFERKSDLKRKAS